MIADVEEARQVVIGRASWAYGMEAKGLTLEALTLWAHEQGLTPKHLPVESPFAPSTLDEVKV